MLCSGRRLLSGIIAILLCFSLSATADTIVLPQAMKVIDEETFLGATSLSSVVVPDGVIRIEARAFADTPLREISLPATLEFLAEDAFEGTQLERIEAPAGSYAREWAKEHGYFEEYAEPQVSNADKIETVIAAGVAVLGAKYKYSGSGPTTFDCSGFVRYCYAKAGVSLPHNSTAISNLTEYTRFTSLGNLKRGDIVCFAFDSSTVDHVAIYMGDGYIIEASSGAGCVRKKYVSNNTYYKTHVARCVRIFD